MGDQNASNVTHDTPNAAPVMLLKGNHEGQVPRPSPRTPGRASRLDPGTRGWATNSPQPPAARRPPTPSPCDGARPGPEPA